MCGSGAMAWGSIGLQLAGTAMQARASTSQYAASASSYDIQSSVMRTNATLAENQAKDAIYRGNRTSQYARRDYRNVRGSAQASMAARGVQLDSGSPVALLAGIDAMSAEDQYSIKTTAEREAYGHKVDAINQRSNAGLYSMKASSERSAGKNAGASAWINGLSSVASSWYSYRKAGIEGF